VEPLRLAVQCNKIFFARQKEDAVTFVFLLAIPPPSFFYDSFFVTKVLCPYDRLVMPFFCGPDFPCSIIIVLCLAFEPCDGIPC